MTAAHDPLWRRIGRRVRRRLYGYWVAEVLNTVQPLLAASSHDIAKANRDETNALLKINRDETSALLKTNRDETHDRLGKLDADVQSLARELAADREAARERLAELAALVETMRHEIPADREIARAHFAEVDRGLAAVLDRLRDERADWFARLARLEVLALEHADVLAASQTAIPFPSPVVSIIMPTWNRAPVVGAAIRSVQAQRFTDWELIVIDDGSSDDTADVMAAFAQDVRIRYVTQARGGQCKARNHALRLARGALVAYLDSDNVWYPGYLAAAVALFAAKPDVDCAYGAMITDVHRPGEHILYDPFDRERLLAANYIGMSTFSHRRALTERYGAFDEELAALEDWDMILRYTEHAPAYRLPALAVRYRVVDDKRVSVVERIDRATAQVKAKWKRKET